LALNIGNELLAKDPTNPLYLIDQSKHHRGLADILRDTKRPDEAETAYRRAIDLARNAAKQDAPDLEQRRSLAGAQLDLARVLAANHKSAEAEKLLLAAAAEMRTIAKDFPSGVGFQQELAQTLRDLGDRWNAAGRQAEARATYQQSVEADERAVAIDPASSRVAIQTGGRMCNFGIQLVDWKDPAAAIVWYDKATKLLEDARRRDPADASAKQFLANTYWNRANALRKTGRDREAIADWRHAAALLDTTMARDAFVESAYANVRLGDMPAAAREVEAALAMNPDAALRFKLAFVLAHAAATVKEPSQVDSFAARAAGILIAMKTEPILSRPETLRTMTTQADFAPLRQRADFQALLAGLKPTDPKKP
jgi:tetratricopeptide (TPR) repeat protein